MYFYEFIILNIKIYEHINNSIKIFIPNFMETKYNRLLITILIISKEKFGIQKSY